MGKGEKRKGRFKNKTKIWKKREINVIIKELRRNESEK